MNVHGFDTETFEGAVKVLCCSDGSYVETVDTDALLAFIYERGKHADYSVFWNIGFDLGCILRAFVNENSDVLRRNHYRIVQINRQMGSLAAETVAGELSGATLQELKELKKELDGLETVERFTTKLFRVAYVNGKAFSVKPIKGKHKAVWCFDAANFYTTGYGGATLEATAIKYLGEGKSDGSEGLDRRRIGQEVGYYEKHRDAIVRYCIRDCQLSARLFQLTQDSFTRIGVGFPEKPFSKASISKAYFKESGVLDATTDRYRTLTLGGPSRFWKASYRGGVFLQLAAGTFHNVRSWDINSAYPDGMRRLVSLEDAGLDNSNGQFNFYQVRARPCRYLPLGVGFNRLQYATQSQPATFYLAEPDLRILQEAKWPYEVVDSVAIVCPSSDRPLSYVERVYADKDRIKKEFGEDSAEYWNVKVFLNGGYGILAQRRPREGAYTNLIYASYITSLCREALWRKALEVERMGGMVLALATDGLHAIGGPAPTQSRSLGDWSCHVYRTVTYFETGIYVADGKLKRRGLPTLTVEMLQSHDSPTLTITRDTPLRLKQALIQRKTALIGAFLPREITLNPAKSFYDGGIDPAQCAELAKVPLREYFDRSWTLRLKE